MPAEARHSLGAGMNGFLRNLLPSSQAALGPLDQVIYSGTNFLAAVVAARMLGPGPFGTFSVAVALWAMVGVLGRSVLVEPFVIRAGALDGCSWRNEVAEALGSVTSVSVGTSIVVAGAAVLLPRGDLQVAILILAVLLPVLAIQDFWRVAAFSAGRGELAILNDLGWSAAQTVGFALLWSAGVMSTPTVLLTWGMGALVGCIIGHRQFHVTPKFDRQMLGWTAGAFRLGKWVGAAQVLQSIGTQVTTMTIVPLAGMDAFGGLRATYTLFGPLAIMTRGLGLPILSTMAKLPEGNVMKVVWLHSAILAGVALSYGTLAVAARGPLLAVAFGDAFRAYEGLFAPVAVAHVAAALALGAGLALRRIRRQREIFLVEVVAVSSAIAGVASLTPNFGVVGAAWGIAISQVVRTLSSLFVIRAIKPTSAQSAYIVITASGQNIE